MFNTLNAILAGGFVVFIILDSLWPARQYPRAAFWRVRGLLSAVLYIAVASYSPYLWSGLVGDWRLIDARTLSLPLAVVYGYAVFQLAIYGWHRLLHKSNFLWRHFHQMHHSAERLDVYGSLYFHPLDMLAFTFFGSLALTIGIGLTPLAAAFVGVLGALVAIFTHANLRTPRWLGWLIARPEMHGMHHQRGRHTGNFAELPLWDMLFGTYTNPMSWEEEVGFYDGASLRIPEMLMGRDVSEIAMARMVWPESVEQHRDPSASQSLNKRQPELFSTPSVLLTIFLGAVLLTGITASLNVIG